MRTRVAQSNLGGVNIVNTGRMRDVTVTVARPEFWTERVEVGSPPDPNTASPGRLLPARHQVTPFVGRERELERLAGWLAGGGAAALLVRGPGGQGKTRLGLELATKAAGAGWAVAQVRHHTDVQPAGGMLAELDRARGLLLLVDYAERWPHRDLLRLFQDPLLRQDLPVRLLLLARPMFGWWESLRHPLGQLGINADELALSTLGETLEDRRIVFQTARERFAALLGVTQTGDLDPPGNLAEPRYGSALTLLMAALVVVDAAARAELPPQRPEELARYLIDRERHHWVTAYDNERVTTPPATMARATFVATLTGPLPPTEARDVLNHVGMASSPDAAQSILDDHGFLYPPTRSGALLEPLLPDRVGEDFVAEQLADPATAEMLAPLLKLSNGQLPNHARRAIAVLLEAARRWPEVGSLHLFPLVIEEPEVALAAGNAALVTLAEVADLDLLERIEQLLPDRAHPDYELGALAVAERLSQARLRATRDSTIQAAIYLQLGRRLSHAGRELEAIRHLRRAVRLLRRLARSNPTHEPQLAEALKKLGGVLAFRAPSPQARAATSEAIDIYERLAAADPSYEHDLAQALNDLSVWHFGRSSYQQARDLAERAVELHRRSGDTDNNRDLALTLGTLSAIYHDLRSKDEALEASAESLAIYSCLYEEDPAAHRHLLALAHATHALGLDLHGRKQESVTHAEKGVELYRKAYATATANPWYDLAGMLTNLGQMLSSVARVDEALEATREAVDLCRPLMDVDPAANAQRMLTCLAAYIQVRRRHRIELDEAEHAANESRQLHERYLPGRVRATRVQPTRRTATSKRRTKRSQQGRR